MLSGHSIKLKLTLLVVFLLIIAAINGLLGMYGMKSAVGGLETVYKDRVVPLRDLKAIADAYAVNIVDTNHKVRNGNLTLAQGIASVEAAEKIIQEKWQAYLSTYLVEEEKRLVTEIEPLMKQGDAATARLKGLFKAGDMAGIAAFSASELYAAIDPISEGFSKLIEVQLDIARSEYDQSYASYERLHVMVILMLLLGSAIGLGVALTLIRRTVSGPLTEAGAVIHAIAAGDLSRPMPKAGSDEIGVMILSLGRMQQSLHDLIGGIRSGIDVLNHSASELAVASAASARVSEDQFEAASGMAASVEQLSVSIDQVDEFAREAKSVSQSTGQSLEESSHTIQNAANGIQGISDAVNTAATTIRELESLSSQISNIVDVIRDIADQTNLLALNAAIEAARAGEQGRGFAVVADEVRKLAERTAKSTQEISQMITRIQDGSRRAVQEMEGGVVKVNDGVMLANQAGDSVGHIREAGQQISVSVDEISHAIREQAIAAREIANKVETIAQGAEQNSASVAQTNAAAQRLKDMAGELGDKVVKFRL